jgi:hypothetical protein
MRRGGVLACVKHANFVEGKTLLTEVKYRYVNYDGGSRILQLNELE